VGFASTGSPLVFPDYRPRPDLQNRHGGYSLHHPTTGAELAHFGYGVSRSGALSPDGRTLAIAEFTGGKPKSKLRLWDVSPLLKNSKPDHMQNDQLLKTAWNALRSDDTTAHEAMRILAAHPRESLQIFLKHLTPEQIRPKVPQQAEIKQWVHALDSGVFQTRDEATRQLENVGVLARPVLETFLKSGVSLETLRRGNLLLDKLKRVPAPAWELQRLRAIDVLEQVHSPEAMRILKNLADGLTESSVTQAAQASLVRLGHPSTKERK
jgi:predicted transcriptional regulator